MLPATARLRAAADFAAVVRRGRRGSAASMVVHLLVTDRDTGPRGGFVVSKKVGNSVVRHRVVRQLRALLRSRLPQLPAGVDLVVRALPAATGLPSSTLGRHLDRALAEAVRRAGLQLRDAVPPGHSGGSALRESSLR